MRGETPPVLIVKSRKSRCTLLGSCLCWPPVGRTRAHSRAYAVRAALFWNRPLVLPQHGSPRGRSLWRTVAFELTRRAPPPRVGFSPAFVRRRALMARKHFPAKKRHEINNVS